jgi:hypothetical protein
MAFVTIEVICLRWLLEDFGVSIFMSTPLLSDSTCAISSTCDPVKHELTKHIGVDVYYTRAQIQDGVNCHRSLACAFRAPFGNFLHEGSDSCPPSVLSIQTQYS